MTEEEFRTGVLADGTGLMQPDNSVEFVNLIDKLRADEGGSVTFICDNPDFNGQPDRAIICCGDWTDWEDRRFANDSLIECLRMACRAKAGISK